MAKRKNNKPAPVVFVSCFDCIHELCGDCRLKYNDQSPEATYSKAVEKIVCDTYYKQKKDNQCKII